jgi:four helix bundle protein
VGESKDLGVRSQKTGARKEEFRMLTGRLPARTFRDLLVWRKAHEFVLSIYKFTATFPRQEIYGLCSQMRRAAISIPANIAEGFRKRGKADKARFMNTAEGSVEESRYYLVLSGDLGYGETSGLMKSLEEVSKILNAYAAAILSSDS